MEFSKKKLFFALAVISWIALAGAAGRQINRDINDQLDLLLREFRENTKLNSLIEENFDKLYKSAKVLLDRGANPSIDEEDEESPIFLALRCHDMMYDLADAKLLEFSSIHAEPISWEDPWGPNIIKDCPVRSLILEKTCRLVDLLCTYNANPNVGSDDYILTPLDLVCNYADAPELVACLLKHGANVNDFNEQRLFEGCSKKKFKQFEPYFNKCSMIYHQISLKVKCIKWFFTKLKILSSFNLSEKQQAYIAKLTTAFSVRLSRLTSVKLLLRQYGAVKLPKALAQRLLKQMGAEESLKSAFSEALDKKIFSNDRSLETFFEELDEEIGDDDDF